MNSLLLHRIVSVAMLMLGVFFLIGIGEGGATSGNKDESFISIPLSSLDIDQATASVSVLSEPRSSLDTIIGLCENNIPEEFQVDGEDYSGQIQNLCGLVEGFAKKQRKPPVHQFQPRGYVVRVPLKVSQGNIRAVVWNANSLENAIFFVDLLQDGKLKAVKVYSTIPWGLEMSSPCTECPVKELVFQASSIRDQLELLKRGDERTGPN